MDRQPVKPPFAYYGGKTTLAPVIANLLPAHEHYVEPFAGSLAVLLAKKPSRAETVNDLDGDLVNFWRVLRDQPDALERACSLTPHARAEYEAAWGETSDPLERARRTWVCITQNFRPSLDRNGWKRKITASAAMPPVLATFASRMEAVAHRLQKVSIENSDALDLVRDYGSEQSVCLYVDPPYLGSTRQGAYRLEMLKDDAHAVLADALNECKASVVLSGYDSPLYADLFDGWHRVDLQGATTLSGATDRVEVLWSNRPLGEPDLLTMLNGESA